ncbi:hypothetical protein SMGD1_0005 [Sulfurimonas gotlandica GD1]|jgi:hypothetical protein|uniref:Uncharacterized protein n=2 Tax=Sulfurimonas TaxID=202746 RepID=H1FRH9_SULGG|nr:hypothetical protein SMGD1_0005 [Sulfurimonas gotlandica GD1]
MLIRLVFLALFSLSLSAYELPKFEMPKGNNPEIVVFDSVSVVKDDKQLYKIKWKTINATDVNITFIGKVDLEGSITVTEGEYNRGPITLMASSKDKSYIDKATINKDVNSSKTTPFIRQDEENESYYNTMPYRGIGRPINRRGIY